ncbi:Ammonium transporter 1 [Smittium culicis]|uniref:Ammonium transporter 1 n=1 Tax=Smittium culicis TaxID=133412 RepID=A0A1R1Y3C5_9FUNG|nr:Ammonium transporter 1 [Smittium culicis]
MSEAISISSTGYNPGDNAWVLTCSALVFIMTPGLGLFYSGNGHVKNTLSSMIFSVMTLSVVSIQWVLFGYSLAFSDKSSSFFIGDFYYGLLLKINNTINPVAPTIPAITLSIYQW